LGNKKWFGTGWSILIVKKTTMKGEGKVLKQKRGQKKQEKKIRKKTQGNFLARKMKRNWRRSKKRPA